MYSTPVNIFKNSDFTSTNQSFTPAVFDCVSPSLNINTATFPTPKEEEHYMLEGSPHSSNNGQMTPLSPCSITDQQNNNLAFVYNPVVVNKMSVVSDLDHQQFSSALSNRKMPLVTHHVSNSVMKNCNQPFILNEYTVPDTFNPSTISNQLIIDYQGNVASPIDNNTDNNTEQVAVNSNKEDDLFSSKNFRHMSREQLIARLLVLENEKNDGASPSKTQVATQCCWKDCNKKFENLKKLISHLTEVHVGGGKASYKCEWKDCPRIGHPFTKRHKMHNHLRTHTGERPFTCSKADCKKKFSRLDSLTTHLKTHSNIRPYVCLAAGCGKAYYHSRSLKKHEKIHENQPSSSSTSVTHQSLLKSSMTPQDQSPPFITYDHQQFRYNPEKMPRPIDYNNSFILNSKNI